MCHDSEATPPWYGTPVTTVHSGQLTLTSTDGTRFAGYLAQPDQPGGAGVLVLPDNRGLSAFYERLTVRLAEQGHPALAIDYFGRTAGVEYHGREIDVMSHLARLTRDGLYADFATGIARLRETGCPAVVSLGFCMGGRFAFLTAVGEFGLDGVIGLYGYPETMHRPPATPSNEVSRAAGRNEQQHSAPGPTQLAGTFTAPVLGLFGGADEGIPPSMVDAFAGALADAGVRHEIHTYPGAPHGFFELELTEHAETQADAWRRILAFVNASVTGSRSRPGP